MFKPTAKIKKILFGRATVSIYRDGLIIDEDTRVRIHGQERSVHVLHYIKCKTDLYGKDYGTDDTESESTAITIDSLWTSGKNLFYGLSFVDVTFNFSSTIGRSKNSFLNVATFMTADGLPIRDTWNSFSSMGITAVYPDPTRYSAPMFKTAADHYAYDRTNEVFLIYDENCKLLA